jgi:predicted HAD superfamily phosphohydrolase
MSTAVQALLDNFDALSESERHDAAVEILRRVAPPSELSDEALVAAADEVFRELDHREAADARP